LTRHSPGQFAVENQGAELGVEGVTVEFDPLIGGQVRVVDGIFLGMQGKVITYSEAEAIRQISGGQHLVQSPNYKPICVLLTVFGRQVPVYFEDWQLEVIERH
jgi:transcription antitermination factor NusG